MKKQKVAVVDGFIVCEYPSIGKTFKAKLADYPKSILNDAMEHGFEQKFGDAKSGQSPAEKYAEVQLIHASLMSGEWNRTASPVDQTPEVLAAVASIMKLKYDAEKGTLSDGKRTGKPSEDEVKTWRAHPEVKAKILENRLAKAKANLETSDKVKLEINLK